MHSAAASVVSERHTRPFYKLTVRRNIPLHASTRRINKTHTASCILGIDHSMHHDVVHRSLRHKHSSPPVHARGGFSRSNINQEPQRSHIASHVPWYPSRRSHEHHARPSKFNILITLPGFPRTFFKPRIYLATAMITSQPCASDSPPKLRKSHQRATVHER